jgi:hypothetical protein
VAAQAVEHWQLFRVVIHWWTSFLYYLLPLDGDIVNKGSGRLGVPRG